MTSLHKASLRHLWRHPAQLALALVGLSLGVSTIVAVDVATASAQRAFELSLQAVNGAATHQISGGPSGIDERLYVRLRSAPLSGRAQLELAPVVVGYVAVGERLMQLIGIDPPASAALGGAHADERTDAGGEDHHDARSAGLEDSAQARRWFTESGAIVMSAATGRELAVAPGAALTLAIDGVPRTAQVIATIEDAGP